MIQISQRNHRATFNPATLSTSHKKQKHKKLKSISLQNGGILEYMEQQTTSPRVQTQQSSHKNLLAMAQQASNNTIAQSQINNSGITLQTTQSISASKTNLMLSPGQVYLMTNNQPQLLSNAPSSSQIISRGILKRTKADKNNHSRKYSQIRTKQEQQPVSISLAVGN